MDILDADGDGNVDEAEWIFNLDSLPKLKLAIEKAVNMSTGKIAGLLTLEDQLTRLHLNITKIDERIAKAHKTAEGLESEKAFYVTAAKKLEEKGIIPSGDHHHDEEEGVEKGEAEGGGEEAEELNPMEAAIAAALAE